MNDILGTGWRFPIRVNARGGLDYSGGEASIAEAIWIILSTPRRSRIMEPAFGCGIHEQVFAPGGAATRAGIEADVRAALVRWEPRIDVLRVVATAHHDEPNALLVEVDYRVRANNAQGNIVYPFYINERSV
ncbi:GPW/gp25 family protein [Paeniglutamicibacter psychrophenolicus]|uniref:Phage baseplate assembly protein W n=1 Tax=Paeniglutamicibacter psychrophenolicus TaxID=257454 RepID=A0ABS4WG45_9MICC|nr:GPW/gp25 family protein [Paeniglutamicibacter psychrophenolicus]MBP2375167.1 phage baseplate assembly protein W [Paeniglutamicibacter psychrophenolicus]